MTRGETVSATAAEPKQLLMAVVVAIAALGLLGCRATLRFDEPEAGADAPLGDRPCTSDQQCSSPFPRCNRTTGHCVGCLTAADCAANQFCDPDHWGCETP